MSWVRIHDAALTHPKIFSLFSWRDPFHVWVWGLSHCQTHLTDGFIASASVPRVGRKAAQELVERTLWDVTAKGWMVHDYLYWNDSRATVTKKRSEARERMSTARSVRANFVRTSPTNNERTSHEVLRGVGKSTCISEEGESEGKPSADDIGTRAGRLREELYPAWYAAHRHGARLRLVANSLEYQDAVTICETWDDARIEKLARIVLTTDDDWISHTDRGFRIFALKATWADDRLREWEQKNGVKVTA